MSESDSCVKLTGMLADLKLQSFVNSDLEISLQRLVLESSSGVDVVGHTDGQSSYDAGMYEILMIPDQLERSQTDFGVSEKHAQ